MMPQVPDLRVRVANAAPCRRDGEYVLYWMTAFRRTQWNFSLERAVAWARELKKPLLVFEALRCGYRWASDRLHHFVIQGMVDNARELGRRGVLYYPYLEPEPGAGKGLLSSLARRACVVVGDDFPCFFLPRMMPSAAQQLPVRFELVDANGLLPLRAADRAFGRAFDFRRFLQKNLRPHLDQFPAPEPLKCVRLASLDGLPKQVARRWPAAEIQQLGRHPERLKDLPIDHTVPIATTAGGSAAAQTVLQRFLAERLSRYELRNQPEQDVTSGLSPYLHFGHISAHQVFRQVMDQVGWTPDRISGPANGSSHGWWGVAPEVEAFLDQLITWREVGYNLCCQREDYQRYESLPNWAQKTLAAQAGAPRDYVYPLEELQAAATHDPLWNAAQRQLLREGTIHNYLRMLWGKKILQWSTDPRTALDAMIELNNKYALDGRNPNSYSGIFWVLGRYDRPWAPLRPVFGAVRYMSSENTARKVRVKGYLARYGPEPSA